MNQKKQQITTAIEAFLSTWAFIRVTSTATTNLLTVFVYILLFYAYGRIKSRKQLAAESKAQQRTEYGLSGLFTFFYVAGSFEQIYQGLDNLLFRTGILFVTILGLFVFFEKIISLLWIATENWNICGEKRKNPLLPAGSSFFCILCWTPYLLKNFPGVMTIDSMNQFAQVLGIYAQSNHHPWVHTQLMKMWYEIGFGIFQDTTLAIACYTLFQMCFMAFCVGFFVKTMQECSVKKSILVATVVFYALVPYNGLYAVTVWKDSMFAGGVLLYTTTLLRFLRQDSGTGNVARSSKIEARTVWNCIMLVISGFLMSLFRTNGWYAFLLTIPFTAVLLKKMRKQLLAMQILVAVLVLVVKGPVMSANHVIQPDLVESLSIPIQQISRVIVEEKYLTEEQNAFLNRILDTGKIKELYNPYVSDGFKRLTRAGNQAYLEEHFGEFLKVYMEIGLKYPTDYLIAFRDQSIGYWFPTQEGIIAGDEGVIVNEFGVENRPILKGPVVIKINEILLKLKDMIPGYGILWSMGAILWLIILSAGITGVRGDRILLLLYVPAIAIFLTLAAATPVAREFRYAYGYVYCLPLYLMLPFLKEK